MTSPVSGVLGRFPGVPPFVSHLPGAGAGLATGLRKRAVTLRVYKLLGTAYFLLGQKYLLVVGNHSPSPNTGTQSSPTEGLWGLSLRGQPPRRCRLARAALTPAAHLRVTPRPFISWATKCPCREAFYGWW